MSLTGYFEKLGAPLVNQRWSWGGMRADGGVVLRVWQDRRIRIDGKWFMMITHHVKYADKLDNRGYQERLRHVEAVRSGAPCYMVMCRAKDVEAAPREIASFDSKDIFVGAEVREQDGDWWVEIKDRIPWQRIVS